MADYIVHHEHFQPHIDLPGFVQECWRRVGLGRVPALTAVQGTVAARINHGRWIVDCPGGCGSAMIVTENPDLFLCPECGSPENGGNWYRVTFPGEKAAIENILLRRPAFRPDNAPARNWIPGETVATLRQENRNRGFPEG